MYGGINGRLCGGKSRGQSRKELERSVWGDADVLYLDRGLSLNRWIHLSKPHFRFVRIMVFQIFLKRKK